MYTEQPVLIVSIRSEGINVKHRFINCWGYHPADITQKALGVSYADALNGEQLPLMAAGVALVLTGASVSAGDFLMSDDQGRAITFDNISGEAKNNGLALDDALGADELIRVLLM